MRQISYGAVLTLLLAGFAMLFERFRQSHILGELMRRSRAGMEEAARQRLLENRRKLLEFQREHSFWYRLELELNYSGWKRKFPFLTAELWMAGNLLAGALSFLPLSILWGWNIGILGVACFWGIEYLFLCGCKAKAFRSVNTNLIKFLDFLGNYSITAGELTGIFKQISKYVDEPMCTALEECSYEAQTTGDSSLALLVMAEKIEHPKFKELVRNMEISIRYCADFTILVNSSRKNMREYLRMDQEQKGIVREAAVNMLLLLLMSVVTLLIVDGLIEASIWTLLLYSWPGRIATGVVAFVLFLFLGRVYRLSH